MDKKSMGKKEGRQAGVSASRRNVLAGLVAGAGISAALVSAAKGQGKGAPSGSGPILFKRTAETERYYKTLT